MKFFGQKKNHLYLDVGSSSLKSMLVSTEGITKNTLPIEEPLFRGTFSNPEVDFERFSQLLQQQFSGFRGDVQLILPDQFTKLIYLNFRLDPSLKQDRNYLLYRLRKLLDSSVPQDVHLDLIDHETPRDEDGIPLLDDTVSHFNVLLVREKLLAGFEKIFASSHFKPFKLAGITSTTAAIINTMVGEGCEDFSLVHLGNEVTTVSIVMKGILLYQRVIEIAGRHLKEFLMESEKLSPVDATMQLHGLQLPDPQAMEKSLRDYPRTELLFSRLINEIALTFKFFQESWNRTLRYPIWLTGGLASVKGIEPFFSGVYKLDAKKLELQKEQISFSTDFAAFPGFLTKKGGE